MTEPLIVPINVRALCVNDAAQSFVGPSSDFSAFPAYENGVLKGDAPYLADGVGRYESTTCSVGVRLHWALPAALRHGTGPAGAGPIGFPAAPNRWLVTRVLSLTEGAPPQLKSWVLESDRLEKAGQSDSASMPFLDGDQGQFFRYMGRWTDYDAWQENPAAGSFASLTNTPLTAVGYGDPLFAAYAPNCANVFAFNDDFQTTLGQVDGGAAGAITPVDLLNQPHQLTYVIVGWFAQSQRDPLAGLAVDGKTNDLKWRFTGDPPSRALFSGAIYGLRWGPTGDIAPMPPSPQVAIGQTAAQALSALMAADPALVNVADAEFALNAVQAGLYQRLYGQTGWVGKLKSELHRRAFGTEHGGWQWSVIDERASTTSVQDAAGQAQEAVLSAGAAHALSVLNQQQRAYDDAADAISTLKQQLFFDWYRRQLLTDQRVGDNPPWSIAPRVTLESLGDFLATQQNLLAAQVAASGTLAYSADAIGNDGVSAPDAGATSLAAAVVSAYCAVAKGLAPTLRLKRSPAPRFWKPADPVILLNGPGAAPAQRDGRPEDLTADGYLPCRSLSNILNPAPVGQPPITLQVLVRRDFSRLESGAAEAANALMVEALLLDGRFDFLSPAFSAQTRATALAMDPAGPTQAQNAISGLPAPAMARTDGGQPDWVPLLMRWTLNYGRVASTGSDGAPEQLSPEFLVQQHVLDDDQVDLQLLNTITNPLDVSSYSGFTPLSSRATNDLLTAMKAAAATVGNGDAELAALTAGLKQASLMAQSASGFHQGLLTREQTLQLNIVDPLEPMLPLAQNIADAVGDFDGVAPDGSRPYAGLRSGFVTLPSLSVVDVFGREVAVDTSRVVWASAFKRPDGSVVLPPRITQPARLQFRWLAAGSTDVEANGHPAASPICGWVVPDLFDNALVLFDAEGKALGSLKASGDGGQAHWRPAPQAGAPLEPDNAPIDGDVLDPDLNAFAKAVLGGGGGYLASLLRTIDRASGSIIPPDPSSGPAMLVGRPLALVRARLSLELKGGPAADQNWLALQAAIDAAGQPSWNGDRDDRGLRAVRVPVRVGDFKEADDGLAAYFLTDTDGYSQCHSPAAETGDLVLPTSVIEVAAQDKPVTIAMLIDPRAQVHCVSGVLPVKAISVPADLYAPALSRLSVSFYAGPMLFPQDALATPLPRLPGWEWRWRTPVNQAWTERPTAPPPNDRARTSYDPQRLEEGWAVLVREDISQ
ncbi:hypothetical protein ASD38_10795 [Caulobacter sp. Root487D2Y]|uniref:hypothetical protein n=1 Tax=Caulobacter sp. Root487D2Y TaxID=1736547 RepID=UPI0006F26077|nr:hypothetical protein [Caulobacter sp. Root487D2Y]KQY29802.1 hypothetical protein ASD38_10795 [Caulobacter sp. Root487D2Y]